jgi:thiol-disulfide isomerase/thioredoxin
MKRTACCCLLILAASMIYAQTPEIERFLDTMKMGGSYLIDKDMREFKASSTEGRVYSSEDLKNKITFINFWFAACSPCMAEMNALEQLHEKFKDNARFQFLSFTFEKKEEIEKLALRYKMSYPIISLSQDDCSYLNQGKGYPVTIIVDRNGKMVFFNYGGSTDPEQAEASFKTYLYPLLISLLKCP